MRQFAAGLTALLAANNAFLVADLVTVTTAAGTYRWTTADTDVVLDGETFSASGPLVERGSTRIAEALQVDTLDLVLKTGDGLTVDGLPLGLAVMLGRFDGAAVTVERAFMPTWGDTSLGTVLLFTGTVADCGPGATSVRLVVKSLIEKLNRKLPFLVQPGCPYQLYSAGCGADREDNTDARTCAAGSTATELHLTAGTTIAAPGWVVFTSGQNNGERRVIRSNAAGVLTLAVALPYAPAAGDTLEVVRGCDKTRSTCDSVFGQLGRYHGFADIPRPSSPSTAAADLGALSIVYGVGRVPGRVVLIDNKRQTYIWMPATPSGDQDIETATTSTPNQWAAAAEVAICEGPIDRVMRIWRDENLTPLLRLTSATDTAEVMTGALDQAAWSYLAAHGLSPTPLGGTAYLRSAGLGLPSGSPPNLEFEVRGFMLGAGSDVVTNGTFAAGSTGWTSVGANVVFVSGAGGNCSISGVGYIYQAVTVAQPGTYRFSIAVNYLSAGSTGLRCRVGLSAGSGEVLDITHTAIGAKAVDVAIPTAGTWYVHLQRVLTGNTVYFDNVALEPTDVDPAEALTDFLTSTRYGLGLGASIIDVDHGPDGLAASSYRRYCQAMGWRVSSVIDAQQSGLEVVQNLLDSTNATAVWSGGKLKVVPLGDTAVTGFGVTYTPPSTAVALGVDDFVVTGKEDPVTVDRRSAADCANVWPVSYIDRAAAYQVLTVDQPDASAEVDGRKQAETFESKWITRAVHAQGLSSILAQHSTYIRNVYSFRVSFKHSALEKGDLVSLTEAKLGLTSKLARVIEVEEDRGGVFRVRAEEWPFGVATPVALSTQTSDGIDGAGPLPSVTTIYPAATKADDDLGNVPGGAAGGANLLANPSFEGPSPLAGWTFTPGGGGVGMLQAAGGVWGDSCAACNLTGSYNYLTTDATLVTADVAGGVRGGWQQDVWYTITFFAMVSGAPNTVAAALAWFGSPPSDTETLDGLDTSWVPRIWSLVLGGAWKRFVIRVRWAGVTPPVNGALTISLTTASPTTVLIDGVMVEAGTTASAFAMQGPTPATSAQLGTASVQTTTLADAAVTTAKVADANVTTAKLADANVTTAKLADLNVTTGKLAASAVTEAKLADGAVAAAKLADGVGTPVGSIIAFAGSTAPTSYLLCNGQSVLRSAYLDLYNLITTTYGSVDGTHFNVPDLRGEFIRGLDGGRGVDTGRALGSAQADAMQGHQHYGALADTAGSNQWGANEAITHANVIVGATRGTYYSTRDSSPIADATNGTPRTAAETRPRNVALNYIIKAL